MEWINQIIRYCYDQGWGGEIYDVVVIIAFATQFAFLLIYREKYGIPLGKACLSFLLIYSVGYFLILVLAWMENGFQHWGSRSIIRVYIYLPLICAAVSKVVKIPAKMLCDFIAPGVSLAAGMMLQACPFAGCSHGYACEWGIWNPVKNTRLFPNQWLESIVALGIVVFLVNQAKKEHYIGKGRIYAIFLTAFGSTRFLLEFLRNNEKLVLGLSTFSFHALFMAIVGTVWLFVLAEKEREEKRKAEHKQQKRKK